MRMIDFVTGWVRIPFTDVIRTTLISVLIPAKPLATRGGQRDVCAVCSEFSVLVRVRIPFTDITRTRLISVPIPAKTQLPEVVRGPDGFLSEFSLLYPKV